MSKTIQAKLKHEVEWIQATVNQLDEHMLKHLPKPLFSEWCILKMAAGSAVDILNNMEK